MSRRFEYVWLQYSYVGFRKPASFSNMVLPCLQFGGIVSMVVFNGLQGAPAPRDHGQELTASEF